MVDAAAFQPMTVGDIADALKVSGFSIVELGDRHIAGTRAIPGHPSTTARQANFARIFGSSAWSGALLLRHAHPRAGQPCGSKLNAPGARFPMIETRLLHQARWLRTIDELEVWLSGVCSQPIDDVERAAIAATCMCEGRGHDKWGNICPCRMGSR